MPVSVVVGGQFGSEGKGKVALEIVRRDPKVVAAIRVGGTNSGHTAVGADRQTYALRQLPAAAADRSVQVILPPGSYIDIAIFSDEVSRLGLGPGQVAVSPMARIITGEHKAWERAADLSRAIGSTQSGTGAAVMATTARGATTFPLHSVQAEEVKELQPFLRDTGSVLRSLLDDGKRVVVEGTQGFGLSLLQGGYWPKATSRDTTAAGFLAEAGLSSSRCRRRNFGHPLPSDPGGGQLRAAVRRDKLGEHCCGGWDHGPHSRIHDCYREASPRRSVRSRDRPPCNTGEPPKPDRSEPLGLHRSAGTRRVINVEGPVVRRKGRG